MDETLTVASLCREMAMTLGLDEPLQTDEDFFDMGGDSLAVAELLVTLEERYGARLEPATVYMNPTATLLIGQLGDRE